ncbi:MAG: MobA/MobL family protein [Lachnospiraceae bacterium]
MGNVTKQASTRFSIVERSKGQSAIEKASYISRSILVSEFDGQTYRPKYHEDLVHSEITLPPNAPKEYADRAALWNAVELSEKGQKSQLARMLKASLPNEWSYELAEEVVRDYVQRNFVDKGMCADWAIHDSENDKGQRNLHIHVLLTMRPLTENGEWGAKQKMIYDLDKNGEKIPVIDKKTGQQKVDKRNRKQWKCHTADSTDWNSKENAKMWRKDLADTINATNEQLGIALHWEHRSFKEQGIDREPTIHIGAVANALERKGRLDLPIVSGKHLRKISDRNRKSNATALDLQSADNTEKFITTRKIDSFESLAKFTADREQKYQQLETVHLSKGQKLNRLKELSKMYALFAPIQATYKESQSLKRFTKTRYDKEHKDSLSKYPELKERMQNLLQNGEKVTPKQWKAEIQSLQSEYDSIGREQTKTATELAYAEVISYNKKNLERGLQNENRQHNRQQNRTKRREEEI